MQKDFKSWNKISCVFPNAVFVECTQTMTDIKSTVKNYFDKLNKAMLKAQSFEKFEKQEKFINDEMDLFDEIVKQKREEYARENNVEERKNAACARISKRIDEIDTKYHHGSFVPRREKELRD